MSIEKGEFICVMGTSGSGKTTFINCISTMDTHSKGTSYINLANANTRNE